MLSSELPLFEELLYFRNGHDGKTFEANRRALLAGRNIDIGHTGLSKFAGTVKMSPLMNESAYRDYVAAINAAAKLVCKGSVNNASQLTKQIYQADETWPRRGYSSSYGVVSGI